MQGEQCAPRGVWPPVPERCEEDREEQGEVAAPAHAAITVECSGVCLPMAVRMLFPFIPGGGEREIGRAPCREGG